MAEPELHVVDGEGGKDPVMLDKVTAIHAGLGAVVGLAGAPWWVPLTLGAGAQLVAYALDRERARLSPGQLASKAVDVGAMVGGWAVGRTIRARTIRAAQSQPARVFVLEDADELELELEDGGDDDAA